MPDSAQLWLRLHKRELPLSGWMLRLSWYDDGRPSVTVYDEDGRLVGAVTYWLPSVPLQPGEFFVLAADRRKCPTVFDELVVFGIAAPIGVYVTLDDDPTAVEIWRLTEST